MTACTITADIGTGSVKVAAYDSTGRHLAHAVGEYAGHDPSRETINPEVWVSALVSSIGELRAKEDLSRARYLILAGQMQDLVLVKEGKAVADALLYFASRDNERYRHLVAATGYEKATTICGNSPDPSGFPAKILWLDDADQHALSDADTLLCGAHDDVAYRLTGSRRTDRTTASTTGLLDIRTGDWSEEIIEQLPIERSILPELCRGDALDGTIRTEFQDLLGLPGDLEVIHGIGDVGASALASPTDGSYLSCYLGTSGWVLDVAAREVPGDPDTGVFNLLHPTQDQLIRVAPLLTATGAVDWFIGLLDHGGDARDRLYADLAAGAKNMTHGQSRVLFLPYLSGERSPFKDPDASGVFLGVRRDTGRAELFRAVLEGVASSVRSVIDILPDGGHEATIHLSGGGAGIAGLPQLLADITNLPVGVVTDGRFAAARALQRLLPAPPACESIVGDLFSPERNRSAIDRKYGVFLDAYTKNRELMYALSIIS